MLAARPTTLVVVAGGVDADSRKLTGPRLTRLAPAQLPVLGEWLAYTVDSNQDTREKRCRFGPAGKALHHRDGADPNRLLCQSQAV